MSKQTNIFDYLTEDNDDEIECTIRVSKPVNIGEFERKILKFTSLKEKERYLKTLDIAIHRKSKYVKNFENIILNYDWRD